MKLFNKIKSYYNTAYRLGHYPSLFSLLKSKNKIFAYYGFLGDSNFGDELVYEAAKKIFEPNILVPYRRFMPISTRIFCYFFKSKFSGLVIGGGTLIGPFWDEDYFLSFVRLKKPIYVHGTGVRKSIQCPEQWKSIFDEKIYGGVRGGISKINLMPVYSDVKIVGDAAFAFFEKNNWNKNLYKGRNVLINIGTHFDYEGQDVARAELKKLFKYLIENNYCLQFLPLHVNDHQMGVKLKLEFPEIVLLENPDTYANAVEIFNNSLFAIGERLHFIVMAMLSQTPFVSINYSEKHDDLLKSIELSHAGFLPEIISFNTIRNIFDNHKAFDWGKSESIIYEFSELQKKEAADFNNRG